MRACLARRTAALALVATTALAACGAPEEQPSSSAPTSTVAVQPAQDERLATTLSAVRVDGSPLELLPMATVRQAGAASPAQVAPEKCGFVASGLLPVILRGHPAAMGVSPSRLTVTLVDLGSADEADRVLADRNRVLDDAECRRITVSRAGTASATEVSEKPTSGAGLTGARVLASAAGGARSGSLLGRHGSVLVLVNNATQDDPALLEPVAAQVVAALG